MSEKEVFVHLAFRQTIDQRMIAKVLSRKKMTAGQIQKDPAGTLALQAINYPTVTRFLHANTCSHLSREDADNDRKSQGMKLTSPSWSGEMTSRVRLSKNSRGSHTSRVRLPMNISQACSASESAILVGFLILCRKVIRRNGQGIF
jgi:hypothetical protein